MARLPRQLRSRFNRRLQSKKAKKQVPLRTEKLEDRRLMAFGYPAASPIVEEFGGQLDTAIGSPNVAAIMYEGQQDVAEHTNSVNSTSGPTQAGPHYDFQLIGNSEQSIDSGRLFGVGDASSINDNGMVAFVGEFQDQHGNPVSDVFLGNGTSAPSNLSNFHNSERSFRPQVHINNRGQVLAFDHFAFDETTRLRIWQQDQPSVIIATSGPGREFDTILHASLNDSGIVTFTARRGEDLLLVTQQLDESGAPQGGFHERQLTQSKNSRPILTNSDDGRILIHRTNRLELHFNHLSVPYDVPASRILKDRSGKEVVVFDNLGTQPGVSDDGQIVVFYAELSESGRELLSAQKRSLHDLGAGPGIFAAINTDNGWIYERISDIAADVFDPNSPIAVNATHRAEQDTDANRNGWLDPSQRAVRIAYIGFDTNGGKGIYTNRLNLFAVAPDSEALPNFDPEAARWFTVGTATLVVQTGQSVVADDGSSHPILGPVADLRLFDAVNNRDRGDITFWMKAESGEEAIVRARRQEVVYLDFDPNIHHAMQDASTNKLFEELGVDLVETQPWQGTAEDIFQAAARSDLIGAENFSDFQSVVVGLVQNAFQDLTGTGGPGVNVKVLGRPADPESGLPAELPPTDGPYVHVFIGDGPDVDKPLGKASATDPFNQYATWDQAAQRYVNLTQKSAYVFVDEIFDEENRVFTTQQGKDSVTVGLHDQNQQGEPHISFEEVANAISHVVTHETGHLFGLAHLDGTLNHLIMNKAPSSPLIPEEAESEQLDGNCNGTIDSSPATDELRARHHFGVSEQQLSNRFIYGDGYDCGDLENSGARLAFSVGSDASRTDLPREAPSPVVQKKVGHTMLNLDTLTPITGDQQEAILQGLEELVDFAAAAEGETSKLSQALPFVGTSLGKAVQLADSLEDGLLKPVANYFLSDVTPTVEELVNKLDGLSLAYGGFDISIGLEAPPTPAGDLQFAVTLDANRDLSNVPLDLGADVEKLDFRTSSSATIDVSASIDLNFAFGVQLDGGGEQEFFIQVDALTVAAGAQTSDLQFDANLGTLGVHVRDGVADLEAAVVLDFNSDTVTTSELANGSISELVTISDSRLDASLALPITVDPFSLGGLDVELSGTLSFADNEFDLSLAAAIAGTVAPGLEILPGSRVSWEGEQGLQLDARGDAYGVGLTATGRIASTDDFAVSIQTDEFEIPGADGSVALSGQLSRISGEYDWEVSAAIDWQPVPFIVADGMLVTLGSDGFAVEATADLAGVNNVDLAGDFDFDTKTYAIRAETPAVWTPMDNVHLEHVRFFVTNRDDSGQRAAARIGASAELTMLDTDFVVAASVNASGFWMSATPAEEDWTLLPVPGLDVEQPLLIVSDYDFVFDISTFTEVVAPPSPLGQDQRDITAGINLLGSATLPENIPAIGGSTLQIAGTLPADLDITKLSVEGRIAFAQPPIIAGLVALDNVGVRLTGAPSIAIFGQGRVLHDGISGLHQDIGVEANLALDIPGTTLSGSLSLLNPIEDLFGIDGLHVLEGDGEFGVNFGTTPLPLPTVGLNLEVELPDYTQQLSLPRRIGASVDINPTAPIAAITVHDWMPFAAIGVDDLIVEEGTVIVAPNGGTIGNTVFERGISAAFDLDVFGTDVSFVGVFDQASKGIVVEAYVSEFNVGDVVISGTGPDGVYEDGINDGTSGDPDPDADNGLYFRAALTPQEQAFAVSGRVTLPGQRDSGEEAFLALTGEIDREGLNLAATIQDWALVPDVIQVNTASFLLDVSFDDPASSSLLFDGDLDLLQTNITIGGQISSAGVALQGSLTDGPKFGGLEVDEFTFSFSTLPSDQHLYAKFSLDLPGAGGETEVMGEFEGRKLTLDAKIQDWEPISTIAFDGSLSADVDLDDRSISFQFDVTAEILGSSTQFVGDLSSSPNGFELFAAANVDLRFANGKKIATLHASIDLDADSSFQIQVGGDFTLPGYKPGQVRLEGAIGTEGVDIYADVDEWNLVPGLTFDGTVIVDTDFQSKSLMVGLDVDADMLGASLELQGELIVDGGQFDLVMAGHVEFGNTKAGLAGLAFDVDLDTTEGFSLGFEGSLSLLGQEIVNVDGQFDGKDNGEWLMTVEVGISPDVEFEIELFDVSVLDFRASLDATLSLTFGSDPSDLAFRVAGQVHVEAEILELGVFRMSTPRADWEVNLGDGLARFPKIRPNVHYQNLCNPFGDGCIRVPYWVSWKQLELQLADPDPTTTVTARGILGANPQHLSANVLQIRGTDAPEQVEVLPNGSGGVIVRAVTGGGDWVTLMDEPAGSFSAIDVHMGAGDDRIYIDPRVQLSTTLRGGMGRDEIHGGGGPNTIYGGNGPTATPLIAKGLPSALRPGALSQTSSKFTGRQDSTGTPRSMGTIPASPHVPTVPQTHSGVQLTGRLTDLLSRRATLQRDSGDRIFGGHEEDRLFGEEGDDIIVGRTNSHIDGGTGVDVINGVLHLEGTNGPDQFRLDRTTMPISAGPVRPDLPSPNTIPHVPTSTPIWLPVNDSLLTPVIPYLQPSATQLLQASAQPRATAAIHAVPELVRTTSISSNTPTTGQDSPVFPANSLVVRHGMGTGPERILAVIPLDAVSSLKVEGGGGDDTITIAPQVTLSAVLHGGQGNDTLRAGDGRSILWGGEGDDRLYGGAAVDMLFGEGGDDLLVGGHASDRLDGGEGENEIIDCDCPTTPNSTSGSAVLTAGNVRPDLPNRPFSTTIASGPKQNSKVTVQRDVDPTPLDFPRAVSATTVVRETPPTAFNRHTAATDALLAELDSQQLLLRGPLGSGLFG